MNIVVKPNAPANTRDNSRIVHQGGESPSFGPVRQPK